MAYKSFIDLLFILLLSTFVLLSESVRMETVDANPAEVSGGGSAMEDAAESVQVTVLPGGRVQVGEEEVLDSEALDRMPEAGWILLVPGPEGLGHQRVMEVWSLLQASGLDVRLGVKPVSGATSKGGG